MKHEVLFRHKELPIVSAVYRIVHTPTGTVYIGRAINVYKRMSDHVRMLRVGRHPIASLQRHWDEDPNSFEFELHEHCPVYDLVERERHFLRVHDRAGYKMYNTVKSIHPTLLEALTNPGPKVRKRMAEIAERKKFLREKSRLMRRKPKIPKRESHGN